MKAIHQVSHKVRSKILDIFAASGQKIFNNMNDVQLRIEANCPKNGVDPKVDWDMGRTKDWVLEETVKLFFQNFRYPRMKKDVLHNKLQQVKCDQIFNMDQIDSLCSQIPNIISAQTEKDTYLETQEIYEILNKEKNNSPAR